LSLGNFSFSNLDLGVFVFPAQELNASQGERSGCKKSDRATLGYGGCIRLKAKGAAVTPIWAAAGEAPGCGGWCEISVSATNGPDPSYIKEITVLSDNHRGGEVEGETAYIPQTGRIG